MTVKSYFIGRTKSWQIVCKGKIISKHISFYLAQIAVERHFKSGKIDNSYKIEPILAKEIAKKYQI
ncbi:MAG: hypothetical protein KAW52_00365 [candidate division Zixibacteria bacterium]|nr:hypothetical protein [candidate division Zixibacteria bacterium]